MPSKILFLTNKFHPQVDGVGDYTFHLSKALLDKDYEISVITNDTWSDQASSIQSPYNIYPLASNWQSPLNWIRIYRKIAALNPHFTILQYVPYSFHRKGLPVGMVFLSFILRFFARGKFLVFFHEVRIKINPRRLKSLLLGIPMWLISGSIHLLSDQSLTSNHYFRKLLKQYGKDANVIPIGANIVPVKNIELPKLVKNHLIANHLILSSFGFNLRGMEIIIPALTKLRKTIPNIKLLVLGKHIPEAKERLLDNIRTFSLEDTIIIPDYLEPGELSACLAITDIFISMDPWNSLDQWNGSSTKSSTMASALAHEKPIIGVKGELTDSLLLNSKAIFFLDAPSSDSLVDAVQLLLKSRKSSRNISLEAFKIYNKFLSWEKIAATHTAILDNLIKTSKG